MSASCIQHPASHTSHPLQGAGRLAVVNGPNLNLLGKRQPEIYGTESFDSFLTKLRERFTNIEIAYFQSNHEGAIIDELQRLDACGCDGIILNAGGYTHTSIALRDCVAAIQTPVVEVHVSDIMQREPFRQHSYLTDVCVFTIMGHGLEGYAEAITHLVNKRNLS